MPKKDDEVTYFSVIYNHLVELIVLSYSREKIHLHTEALWGMLTPYIDEKTERLWKKKQRQQNQYKAMLWRLRVIMLTLYEIETLPRSNVDQNERVFSDYEPDYYDDGAKIANQLEFKDLMMRFYYLLTDLVAEGYDVDSMNYMADVGYYMCSPYLTWEDMERWKQANDLRNWGGKWAWFREKLGIISSILDREGLQFSRRAIDQVGVGDGVPNEEIESPHPVNGDEDVASTVEQGKIIIDKEEEK